MVSYNNSNVVQCLRQYDMFANSLNLVKTREEKDMIVKQLTKLENKIIDITNEIYEADYNALANKECGLIEEEQNRLNSLIDLINQRLLYIEKRCNNHYQLTGESIDIKDVLGASDIESLEERLNIIGKYSNNLKLEKDLREEIESLTNKISLASEKVEINKSLNEELEKKFSEVLSLGFEECNYYSLVEDRDSIEYAYYEIEKSLTLAELNLEAAKTSPLNILKECQMMFDEIKNDYNLYKEKISILKLMDIFNREVDSYEDLLSKRKEISELFRYIKNEKFLSIVMETITKQYNTILMEQQDVNTYNDLTIEKNRKLDRLTEILDENNSERFQNVLEELIRNEEARQAKILEEQRRIEEEERRKRLELERKKQEEILRRQKIIEDARKKEMEKRTKELLEQQQKSVLQNRRRETGFSFETIKDISNNKEDIVKEKEEQKELNIKEEKIDENNDISSIDFDLNVEDELEEQEEVVKFKDKVDIEKELFEEFNNGTKYELNLDDTMDIDDEKEDDFFKSISSESKFPDGSIDDYMKKFNEDDIEEKDVNSMFSDDDLFPNIPF